MTIVTILLSLAALALHGRGWLRRRAETRALPPPVATAPAQPSSSPEPKPLPRVSVFRLSPGEQDPEGRAMREAVSAEVERRTREALEQIRKDVQTRMLRVSPSVDMTRYHEQIRALSGLSYFSGAADKLLEIIRRDGLAPPVCVVCHCEDWHSAGPCVIQGIARTLDGRADLASSGVLVLILSCKRCGFVMQIALPGEARR